MALQLFRDCTFKRYSSLTVDYEEYFKLTIDFYFDTVTDGSTEAMGVTSPCTNLFLWFNLSILKYVL